LRQHEKARIDFSDEADVPEDLIRASCCAVEAEMVIAAKRVLGPWRHFII
jgi:hypothetical protein